MHGAGSEAKYRTYIEKHRKLITRIRQRLEKQEKEKSIADHMTIA